MKLQVPFIQLPVTFDAEAMAHEIAAIEEKHWRGRTLNDDGNTALTLITVGGDPNNDELAGDMRPTEHLARCPYVMQALEYLGATWGRARLMRMTGQAEVRAHVDTNYYWRERMRVHVPVVTTPSVRFECGDVAVNMAAGECWIFDTWRRHRVLNQGDQQRIHLVADTVGGDRLWSLLEGGRAPGHDRGRPWLPEHIQLRRDHVARLDFERFNAPRVMTPWEMREHIVFLLDEAARHPKLAAVHQSLLRLSRRWHALWAIYGEDGEGRGRYASLLDGSRNELLALGVGEIGLKNEVGLWQALSSHVFDMALPGTGSAASARQRDTHGVGPAEALTNPVQPSGPAMVAQASGETRIERPIFIVSLPRTGSTLLFETLSRAPMLHTTGEESHHLIEGIEALSLKAHGHDSNRLDASSAVGEVIAQLRARFVQGLRDSSGGQVQAGRAVRMLEKTPKNALRVPFLAKVFPDALFVYLHRDPRQVLSSMADGWNSGLFVTYPTLPDWSGPSWSFLLTPGWRDLVGKDMAEIVAGQWSSATEVLLEDLSQLPSDRWLGVDYADLVAQPGATTARICAWAGVDWKGPEDERLPLSRFTLTPPDAEKWRKNAAWVESVVDAKRDLVIRALEASRHSGK